MCFLVNNVTEVHQSFRITDINFTLFLVLFAKKLKMLSSLCKRALKYLSISLYLAIGVGYMWHISEIWKWSPFPQRRSFSLFRFCIFPSAICQFYVFLPFFHPTLKTEDHLLGKGILPHTLLTFYFRVANIQVKSDPVLARIWYSALPHSRLRSLPLFSKHLVSR